MLQLVPKTRRGEKVGETTEVDLQYYNVALVMERQGVITHIIVVGKVCFELSDVMITGCIGTMSTVLVEC